MKTFVFLACLLTVTYAAHLEKVSAFFKVYENCANKLGSPKDVHDSKALKCVAEKANLYDKHGKMKKHAILAYTEHLFKSGTGEKGKKIISKCIDKGNAIPGNNHGKAIAAINCALKKNIMDLIPQPQ